MDKAVLKPFDEMNIPDRLCEGMTPMEMYEHIATLYAALVDAYRAIEAKD